MEQHIDQGLKLKNIYFFFSSSKHVCSVYEKGLSQEDFS